MRDILFPHILQMRKNEAHRAKKEDGISEVRRRVSSWVWLIVPSTAVRTRDILFGTKFPPQSSAQPFVERVPLLNKRMIR